MEIKETKARSIRASEETFEKFKALTEEFENQGDCLENLIRVYEINQAKQSLTEVKADVESYEVHINAIQDAFLHVLQINADAKEIARLEFVDLLNSKEKTIADYQERLQGANICIEQTLAECDEKVAKFRNENEQLESQIRQLESDKAVSDKAVADLEKSVADKEEIIKDKSDIIETLKKDLSKLDVFETVTQENTRLKAESQAHQSEIDKLKVTIEQMQRDIDFKVKETELQIKQAVTDTKAEYTDKIEQLNARNNALLTEISNLKDALREKETKSKSKKSDANSTDNL